VNWSTGIDSSVTKAVTRLGSGFSSSNKTVAAASDMKRVQQLWQPMVEFTGWRQDEQ
jgi:hypothetical protein